MSSGFLLIDKPSGLTSHDVVARARRALGTKKVGHAGTLDPMATGLLVLGFNQGTKLLTFAVGLDKTYLATIRLGSATVTDDAEGEIISSCDVATLARISQLEIEKKISKLTGEISQIPSSVSAIKVSGVRAYDLVRSGEQVALKARNVTVSVFEILSIYKTESYIDVQVRVDCSSGTYIRALARDLGAALSVGGHLTELRRTRVGDFNVEQAYSLEDLQNGTFVSSDQVSSCEKLMPRIQITQQQALALRQGQRISGEIAGNHGAVCEGQLVAVVSQVEPGEIKSLVVFEDK